MAPPIDFEARRLRGSRRPAPRESLDVPALATTIPGEFVAGSEAANEWARTIAPAIEAGVIGVTDRALAVAHCELWSTWRSQLAEAAAGAHVLHVGPNSHPIPNPVRGMANTTAKLLRGVDLALGLAPTVRGRVQVDRVAKRQPSKVDRFIARKRRVQE